MGFGVPDDRGRVANLSQVSVAGLLLIIATYWGHLFTWRISAPPEQKHDR